MEKFYEQLGSQALTILFNRVLVIWKFGLGLPVRGSKQPVYLTFLTDPVRPNAGLDGFLIRVDIQGGPEAMIVEKLVVEIRGNEYPFRLTAEGELELMSAEMLLPWKQGILFF